MVHKMIEVAYIIKYASFHKIDLSQFLTKSNMIGASLPGLFNISQLPHNSAKEYQTTSK